MEAYMTAVATGRKMLATAAAGTMIAGGVLATTAPAQAADGTPDAWNVSLPGGWVIWDDYYGSKDRDNFVVQDKGLDGTSFEIRIYWNGRTYKKHLYHNDKATVDIGNVPKGRKVYFKTCVWNNGHVQSCVGKMWFRE
ncbi:hypothetical protein [Actinomadura coerulea]|uniref:hypothetical protein n=1 Tax=Actinomadura coerulea TaxID=46159 RepID=UPI00342CF180